MLRSAAEKKIDEAYSKQCPKPEVKYPQLNWTKDDWERWGIEMAAMIEWQLGRDKFAKDKGADDGYSSPVCI